MNAYGILFLSKTRPLASKAADGTFQLTLLGMDRIALHQVEPWRVTWAGEEAQAFWEAHKDTLSPGQPLRVMAQRIRSFAARSCAPEVQAIAKSIELAPRSTEATQPRQAAEA